MGSLQTIATRQGCGGVDRSISTEKASRFPYVTEDLALRIAGRGEDAAVSDGSSRPWPKARPLRSNAAHGKKPTPPSASLCRIFASKDPKKRCA
jgi:hypothetical protein